jgi:hypothetical protein
VAILADDEDSWPTEVRKLFDDNLDLFKQEIAWDKDLEERHEQDHLARWISPPNPFRSQRDLVLNEAENQLRSQRFVGYHCCRLLDCEVESILRNGMAMLSPELVATKIATALQHGHLTLGQATQLQKAALVKEDRGNRNGMIWFVFCRSTLRTDVSGLESLLGYWGGEAIYFDHVRTALGQHLAGLGRPRIVEAEVPVASLQVFMRTADRLLAVFLWRRDVSQPNCHTFEGHSTASLPAAMIREVYTAGSPDFEALTSYSTWDV